MARNQRDLPFLDLDLILDRVDRISLLELEVIVLPVNILTKICMTDDGRWVSTRKAMLEQGALKL